MIDPSECVVIAQRNGPKNLFSPLLKKNLFEKQKFYLYGLDRAKTHVLKSYKVLFILCAKKIKWALLEETSISLCNDSPIPN